MKWKYKIRCNCGHEASASCRERDSCYSSWVSWCFSDLNCADNDVCKRGEMSLETALQKAKPCCLTCGGLITTNMVYEEGSG